MQITKEKPKFNLKWLLIAALGAGALYFFKDKFGFLRRGGKELTFEPGAIDYPEYVRPNTLPFPNYKPIEQSLTDCLSAAGNDLRAQPNCIKMANRAIAMATNNYQNKNWGGGSGSHNWGGGHGGHGGSPRPSKPRPIPRHSPGRCINVGSISICPGCIRIGSRIMSGCRGGGFPFPRPSPHRPSSKWAWWKHGPHRSHHYWSHDHRWWWDSRGRRWRGQHERDDDDGRGGWSGGGHGGGGAGYPGHRYSPSPQQRTKRYYEGWQRRASDTEVARQYGLTPYKNDAGIAYMRGLAAKIHVA